MFGKKDEELQIGKQEKNNKKKERVRNREIVIVTCFFSLLMLAVIGNIIHFMVKDSEEAINNAYNPRQELLATRNVRGTIYSADGEILAQTVRSAMVRKSVIIHIRIYLPMWLDMRQREEPALKQRKT